MINNKQKITMTAHGYERLLERTQCKRSHAVEYLTKVWDDGKTIDSYDKKSPMFKYLSNAALTGGHDRSLRVKGNTLFIFDKLGTTFITCFEIAQKILQDKGAKGGHETKKYIKKLR